MTNNIIPPIQSKASKTAQLGLEFHKSLVNIWKFSKLELDGKQFEEMKHAVTLYKLQKFLSSVGWTTEKITGMSVNDYTLIGQTKAAETIHVGFVHEGKTYILQTFAPIAEEGFQWKIFGWGEFFEMDKKPDYARVVSSTESPKDAKRNEDSGRERQKRLGELEEELEWTKKQNSRIGLAKFYLDRASRNM